MTKTIYEKVIELEILKKDDVIQNQKGSGKLRIINDEVIKQKILKEKLCVPKMISNVEHCN